MLILAGVPGVKPDRMLRRFVAAALGVPIRQVGVERAADLVAAAAAELNVSVSALDHQICTCGNRTLSLVRAGKSTMRTGCS